MRLFMVRIIGKDHVIEYFPAEHPELKEGSDTFVGRINHERQRIFMEDGQTLACEQDTLLHEVLHGVERAMDLDLEETKVRRMATGLLAVLRDNPEFVAYLAKKD